MKHIGLVDGDALRREYMCKSAGKDKLRIGTVINTLETMPILHPVDAVEVVHARWVFDEHKFAHCSQCGYEQDWPEWTTPYCPECGAKMGGGDQQ